MQKILIVDDSATMRKIIRRVLRQAGMAAETILEASGGVEALAQLASNGDVGLMLCDIHMPKMNGIDLVKIVRKKRGRDELPIIIVTTEGGGATLRSALRGGANRYVTKPFTAETIRNALVDYL